MVQVPNDALDAFRNNGFYVIEIPPYHGDTYAIIPKDELEDPDDFDLNKMNQYNGLSLTRLDS